MKRLPDEDGVYRPIVGRDLLRGPETDPDRWQQVGQLHAHAVVRLDGQYCGRGYATPQDRLGELAGARSEIEYPCTVR